MDLNEVERQESGKRIGVIALRFRDLWFVRAKTVVVRATNIQMVTENEDHSIFCRVR